MFSFENTASPESVGPALASANEKPTDSSGTCRTSRSVGALTRSNENKMSDGGRGRVSLEVKVWKSSQKRNVQRSAVRSIAWLGLWSNRQLTQAHPMRNLRLVKLARNHSATLLISDALGGLLQCATVRDREGANTAGKPLVLARYGDPAKCDELGTNLPKARVAPVSRTSARIANRLTEW